MIKSLNVLICSRNNLYFAARNPSFLRLVSAMATSKTVVEYAKSGRSTCKKCAETIAAKTVRLGVVTKDPRGYEATKWHHLNCFPISSVVVGSAEAIEGFSLLESDDQEDVKKLIDGSSQSREEVQERDESKHDDLGDKEKKMKVRKREEGVDVKTEVKKSTEPEVIVEYAKSGRSACKKCMKTITSSSVRLGLVSRDPRGYNATKWYHSNCCPLDSVSIASAEAINGFSELKSNDQETLKTLLEESSTSGEKERNESNKDANSVETKLLTPGSAKLEISFSITDISDKYKDAKLSPKWKAFRTVIFREKDDGLHDSSKIAAFDFDGCLANTDVRKTGADAWSLMYSSIPEKLQSLYKEGYKLVIFTNESNIDRWKNKRQVAVDSKIGRLNSFIDCAKVPIQVFIACGIGKSGGQAEDPFRKPNPGMWYLMEQHFNSGISIDMDSSFYVGDAAGRKNDHSDADMKFAQAIGLKFYVPEEYFPQADN